MMTLYRFLADAIVVVHFAYVAFVVLGLVVILVGRAAGWRWVRNFWFRAVHLLMIAVVVFEALAGIVCPLTTWEFDLRVAAGEDGDPSSFVGRLVHGLMFFNDCSEGTFTAIYCVFGLAVLGAMVWAPPCRPNLPRGRRPA
jgi:hypothetical protein